VYACPIGRRSQPASTESSWRTERARRARVEVESLRDRYPRECGAVRVFDVRICPVSDRERVEGFRL